MGDTMRTTIAILMFMLCSNVGAAIADWTGLHLSRIMGHDRAEVYTFTGYVYGENGELGRCFSDIYGHLEDGGFYLKQHDFSVEMMDPTFIWWSLALYGDIVGETTFGSYRPVEPFYYDADADKGGTLIETPDDFYMAFKVSEVLSDCTGYVEGMSWYGWVHVSIDDNLEMTLLDSGIDLYGGAVTVGAGIPEPSGGVLMLLGLAALRLRRRAHGSVTFLAVLKPVKGTCISFK